MTQGMANYREHRDSCNTCNGSELCDIGERLFGQLDPTGCECGARVDDDGLCVRSSVPALLCIRPVVRL